MIHLPDPPCGGNRKAAIRALVAPPETAAETAVLDIMAYQGRVIAALRQNNATMSETMRTLQNQVELLKRDLTMEKERNYRFTQAALRCAASGLATATLTDALRHDADPKEDQ